MDQRELHRLVVLGYSKLAVIIVGIALLVSPIILHPGLRGAQVSLVAEGVFAILVALWQRATGAWTTLFSTCALLGALLILATAYFVMSTDPSGIVLRDVLGLAVLVIIWYALPAIRRFERNHRL